MIEREHLFISYDMDYHRLRLEEIGGWMIISLSCGHFPLDTLYPYRFQSDPCKPKLVQLQCLHL